MNEQSVLTNHHDGICTVTLNRPDKRNAVDGPTADALRRAFTEFEENDTLKVAVLAGAGGNFCSGADLEAMGDENRRNKIDPHGTGHGPMGPTRMHFSKPVIAAVSGYAVAGGLELALMCDMRIVEASSVFGVFCRRWGVPLIDGGTVRLPVHSEEALSMGLANQVVPDGSALATAQELAKTIAGFPQRCLRADRGSAMHQWDLAIQEALIAEGASGYPVVLEEAIAGARKFTEGAGRHGQF